MKKLGLTVTEIVVVLGILTILLGALVPVITNYLPSLQLNGSARVLVSSLREAQEKAITQQNQHLIRFSPAANPPSYSLIRIYDSTEEVLREESLPTGETLTLDPTITNNQIVFSSDGGPSSSGNITLGINGLSKIISVSPAGFIKIES